MAAPTGPHGAKKRKLAVEGVHKGAVKENPAGTSKAAGLKKPRVDKAGASGGQTAGMGKAHKEGEEEGGKTTPLDRKARKEVAEARKAQRKPNYELEKSAVVLWEKLRQRNLDPAERSRLVTSILQKMRGKLCQLALSHTSSRVVQTCVKHCTPEERAAIFEELRPHCVELAKNTYAHHLVIKMLDLGSKEQRQAMLSLFHGHAVALLRHPSASHVVEHAYQLANGAQKQALVAEFYSPEFRLFHGIETSGRGRLADILAEREPAKRRAVLEHLARALQPIVEKGIVDHSIIHRALAEFVQEAPKGLWQETVLQLSGPLLVRMLHTRDGVLVACTCVAAGSAKERKKIVKGLKEHAGKVAQDDHGNLVLLQILDAVDDTLLVRKVLIAELMKEVLPLALHKYGRRVLLHLLAPHVPRYFPADVIATLQRLGTTQGEGPKSGSDAAEKEEAQTAKPAEDDAGNAEGDKDKNEDEDKDADEDKDGAIGVSKKDPEVRRWELLHDSKLSQEVASVCAAHAGELLRSQHGTDVIYEVASGGVGGIMWRSVPSQLPAVHEAIAELACLPRPARAKPRPQAPSASSTGLPQASKKRKKRAAGGNKEEGEEGEMAAGAAEAVPAGKQGEAKSEGQEPEAEEEEEHVLDHFFAGRTIRRLVLEAPSPLEGSGARPFAAVLWETALAGRCHLWADGHSAKVVAAMASCKHEPTRAAAIAELRPLLARGALTCVQRLLPRELLEPATNVTETQGSTATDSHPKGPKPGGEGKARGAKGEETKKGKKKGAGKSDDGGGEGGGALKGGLSKVKKEVAPAATKVKDGAAIAKKLKRKPNEGQ